MKILVFDLLFAQPLNGAKFHGGGEYIKSVFRNIVNYSFTSHEFHVCYNPDLFLDKWIIDIIKDKHINTHYVKSVHDIVTELIELSQDNEVRFFTGMIYPYDSEIMPTNLTSIGVCHGIRPIEKLKDTETWRYESLRANVKEFLRQIIVPEKRLMAARKSFSILFSKFDIIITDSNHSAYSIKNHFPIESKNLDIRILYPPSKIVTNEVTPSKADKFIMMVSANRWLKNSFRGVQTLDRLYGKGYLKDIRSRIYGGFPIKMQNALKNKEMFDFYDYVSTEDLEQAYCDCEVFFYPTLNEGFGLPPLEAMKYGKTCVISSVCSLPEVYGNAVYYVNPYDISEMEGRILQALEYHIEEKTIFDRVNYIQNKQIVDLDKLCQIIINQELV